MKAVVSLGLLSVALLAGTGSSFFVARPALPSTTPLSTRTRGGMTAGLFDGLFLSDAEKEEAYQKQQEILRARQNPEKQRVRVGWQGGNGSGIMDSTKE